MSEVAESVCEVGEAIERQLDSVELTKYERIEFARLQLQLGYGVELRDIFEDDLAASEAAQCVGQIALKSELSDNHELGGEQLPTSRTLMDASKNAKQGSEAAKAMVRQNVATDRIERSYKSKMTLNVRISVGEDGSWSQNGQSYDDVHDNGEQFITHPLLKQRSIIENANKRMITECFKQGLLKDNVIVIDSRVTDGITSSQADEIGWFGDTMSKAWQLIYEEDGEIIIESNFLAGSLGRDEERFDRESTERAHHEVLKLDSMGLSAEEMLARPKLVPKTTLPAIYSTDGQLMTRAGALIDSYDGASGRFFGREHEGARDYRAHLDECRRREVDARAEIAEVTQQLIHESHMFKTATDATQRLHELNEAKLKKAIVVDISIDPAVLGPAALPYVLEARHYYQAGDIEQLNSAYDKVVELGTSSSCPTGTSDILNSEDANGSTTLDDCEFTSKECPKCHKKNVKTVVKKGKYHGACGCVG